MSDQTTEKSGGGNARMYIAAAVAVFSLLVIAANWTTTEIKFIFFQASMPLTLALALTFVGGGVTGALVMRRRTTKK